MTPFGKFIREIRKDKSILLKTIADSLGLKPSYLSNVEKVDKPVPSGMIDKIADNFKLTAEQVKDLKDAAMSSVNKVKVDSLDWQSRGMVNTFARKISELDEDKRNRINEILNEE